MCVSVCVSTGYLRVCVFMYAYKCKYVRAVYVHVCMELSNYSCGLG